MKEKGFKTKDMPCEEKMQPNPKMSKLRQYQLIIKGGENVLFLLRTLIKFYMMLLPTTIMMKMTNRYEVFRQGKCSNLSSKIC
jgi:hypothetical protein